MITNVILFWWLPSLAVSLFAIYLSDGYPHDLLMKDLAQLALLTFAGGWFAAFLVLTISCAESAKDPNSFWNKPILKKREKKND